LVVARVGGYGAYGSTNFGATWTPLPVGAWCIATSADGNKLVAAFFTHNGFPNGCICTSTNSGTTWTQTGAPVIGWTSLASSADGNILVATPGHTAFPTGGGPIHVSTNSGTTWTPTSTPSLDWSSVACSADGTKIVAAVSYGAGAIYSSVDSGANWVSNSVPFDGGWVACSADGSQWFAAVSEYPAGGIYISQFTPAPFLDAKKSGRDTVLSWIVPSANFRLEQTTDFATANWADVTNAPSLNFTNLRHEVTVSALSSNAFYRLKH
jgi:hypothetical protein